MNQKPTSEGHLVEWINHPGFVVYLGRSSAFKLEVLATIASKSGTLASVARRYSVTRQAAHQQAKKARIAFGL